jgi:hypothetical protein
VEETPMPAEFPNLMVAAGPDLPKVGMTYSVDRGMR